MENEVLRKITELSEKFGKEIGKLRVDVQKLDKRVGELNYKFDEYREWTNERFDKLESSFREYKEWTDLRLSTLREVTSVRPMRSRSRYKATRDAMPSPYGCNDKGWVDYEPF